MHAVSDDSVLHRMVVAMKRPDSFEFTMGFVGDPEAGEVRAYVEKLEAELERAYKKYDNMVLQHEKAVKELKVTAEERDNWKSLCEATSEDYLSVRAALAEPEPAGEVVVTWSPSGQIAAVSRQDKDGGVLSIIAEAQEESMRRYNRACSVMIWLIGIACVGIVILATRYK